MYKNPEVFAPDMDYFKNYPAPMFEAMHSQHISSCNSTTPYYGPFLYWLCRVCDALTVMEIGLAQGWSSFFMASAVKDHGMRHGVEGTYYGVDIADMTPLFEKMNARGVNAKFIHKDSLKLVPEDFDNKKFELIFQDGWHSTEYVLDELALLSPHLKDNGNGYWVMHDAYSWCEEGVAEIQKLHPKWELVRFLTNYGFAIFRNMDNYDYTKKFWDGPQKHYSNMDSIMTHQRSSTSPIIMLGTGLRNLILLLPFLVFAIILSAWFLVIGISRLVFSPIQTLHSWRKNSK